MDPVLASNVPPTAAEAGAALPSEHGQIEALLADLHLLATKLKQVTSSVEPIPDMAPVARSVLGMLGQFGPQTVPQLARHRSSSRQNIQVVVNRLLAGGYVKVMENPGHKRSGFIGLTPEGQQVLENSPEPQAKVVDLVAQRVPQAQVAGALEVLQQIKALLAELSKPSNPGRPHRTFAPTKAKAPIEAQAAFESFTDENELPVSLL